MKYSSLKITTDRQTENAVYFDKSKALIHLSDDLSLSLPRLSPQSHMSCLYNWKLSSIFNHR